MSQQKFDRARENVGNIISLEHVNVTVPDQALATFFYVSGLGFTRDPYIDFGPFNVWINVGKQQFHLPTNSPQVLRGRTGVVVPSLEGLAARLNRIERRLKDTRFSFKRQKSWIDVTCPWGNRIRCHAPGKQFGDMKLGIPYVELEVPKGTCEGIARFYVDVMDAPATSSKGQCTVNIGTGQQLRYKEASRQPDYDGHHIAIYVADFSGPYEKLRTCKRISEESDQHQYRFKDIYDPKTGKLLFELEHEVRSLHHPMFMRDLTNRNAEQSFMTYTQGRDAFVP